MVGDPFEDSVSAEPPAWHEEVGLADDYGEAFNQAWRDAHEAVTNHSAVATATVVDTPAEPSRSAPPVRKPLMDKLALGALSERVKTILGPTGMLASMMPNYTMRPGQMAMSLEVAQALAQQTDVIVEAGTGTGKSFAYLLPVLLSDKKVIISTASKVLQEQLFHKDVRFLEQVLGKNLDVKILKGRSNYACLLHADDLRRQGSLFDEDEDTESRDKRELLHFVDTSVDGDLEHFKALPQSHPLVNHVRCDAASCAGKECPYQDTCFLLSARQQAREAQVLIMNHALLMGLADYGRQNPDYEGALPQTDLLVIDEAHHVPHVAREYLGRSFISQEFEEKFLDILTVVSQKMPELTQLATPVQQAVRDFPEVGKAMKLPLNAEVALNRLEDTNPLQLLISRFLEAWRAFAVQVLLYRDTLLKEPETQSAFEALGLMSALLEEWLHALLSPLDPKVSDQRKKQLDHFAKHYIHTVRLGKGQLRLHSGPLSVKEALSEMWAYLGCAKVFTSATIAGSESYVKYFMEEVGVDKARFKAVPSPFDYARQGGFLILPLDPTQAPSGHEVSLVDALWPLVEAVDGGVLVLSTSVQGVDRLYEAFEAKMAETGQSYPMRTDRKHTKGSILEWFRHVQNGILIGTMGLWEGVDLSHECLNMVVIDKLPFLPPTDPFLEAKKVAMGWANREEFPRLQIPHVALKMKQGMGRLIRNDLSRGLVVLADNRLNTKHYGKGLKKVLPPFTPLETVDEALDFWSRLTG